MVVLLCGFLVHTCNDFWFSQVHLRHCISYPEYLSYQSVWVREYPGKQGKKAQDISSRQKNSPVPTRLEPGTSTRAGLFRVQH
jgi:hypothetical protein